MKTRKKATSAGLILLTIISFVSCKKLNDPTTLGDDLIPAVDNVTTFERFLDVETDNFLLDDSTRIGYSDENALGVLNDPVFGTTTGEIYFAIQPPVFGAMPFVTNNPDSTKVDSVVLSLAYSRILGDSTSVQDVQAFEISQSADFDSIGLYYPISNTPFTLAGSLSNPVTIEFDSLNNSQTLIRNKDTTTLDPHVRIPLDNSLFDRFLAYDTATNGAYKSDSLFRSYFKGIALKTVGGDSKALAYLKEDNSTPTNGHILSGVTFYCRIRRNGSWDTTSVIFPVSPRVSANLVRRDATGSEYENNLGTPPPTANKDKLYIQSSPGSYATARILGLDTLPNVVVHRAELQITALSSQDDDKISKPSLLFLDAIDSSSNIFRTIPIDFTVSNGVYDYQSMGGKFNYQKTYFNITRYVQSIVTKHDSLYTLRIYAPFETNPYFSLPNGGVAKLSSAFLITSLLINPQIAYGRVVIAGGAFADDTKRLRLRIVYSKI